LTIARPRNIIWKLFTPVRRAKDIRKKRLVDDGTLQYHLGNLYFLGLVYIILPEYQFTLLVVEKSVGMGMIHSA